MVATAAGNKEVSKHLHGGSLKSCKLRMRLKFNVLVQIYSVGFLHLQLIHILGLSPQVMVYLAWVLAKPYTGVESGFSRPWYGVRVVQTTLQALFQSTTTGVVVQDFRSSSAPVTHKYYSRRTLWFGSSRANHSV